MSILKTASDDADTLSLAHENNNIVGLPDGESATTSKLGGTEFDFDLEIINTATYQRSSIMPEVSCDRKRDPRRTPHQIHLPLVAQVRLKLPSHLPSMPLQRVTP